jgi:hypothetical protein
MKYYYYLLLFLLFHLSFYAQNDSIPVAKKSNVSVVSADKMNVVYRGIRNPISIAVNDVKSFKVIGDTVFKLNDKYILIPHSRKESKIIIEIEKNDGSKIREEHTFRVIELSKGLGTINGENCEHCIIEMSKKELLDAEISAKIPDFLFNDKVTVRQFNVKFFDETPSIIVEGNKFNEEVKNKILNAKVGSFFIIHSIRAYYHCDCNEFAKTIKIMISE